SIKLLSDLLQFNLDIITFIDEEDIEPSLRKLKNSGCDLVVSDQIGSTVEENIGLNSILISSRNESVVSSLDKTIQLVQSMLPLQKEKEIFKQIATNLSDISWIFNDIRMRKIII